MMMTSRPSNRSAQIEEQISVKKSQGKIVLQEKDTRVQQRSYQRLMKNRVLILPFIQEKKAQLLERHKKVQNESVQNLIKENREKVLRLRRENKLLHQKLAEALSANKQVTKEAFQSRGVEKLAFKNLTGKAAVEVLDQKVYEKMKKLNALNNIRTTLCHRLEKLKSHYNTVKENRAGLLNDGLAPQKVRVLDSNLAKALMKCEEAEHVMKCYQKLKNHLQEESATFQCKLDALKHGIVQQEQELREMQLVNYTAHQAKDIVQAEQQHQKSTMNSKRIKRILVLKHYRKQADEYKKDFDQKPRRPSAEEVHLDDEPIDNILHSIRKVKKINQTIYSLKRTFKRITEATGATDPQAVLDRFISQLNTDTHLEHMKVKNERELQQLKEERDTLRTQYQDQKYSGETELVHGKKMLEECESQLQSEQQRRDTAIENLDKITHMLNVVTNAVWILCDKVQHIELQDVPVQRDHMSPPSVLDLLREAELKLIQLQDKTQGHDTQTFFKEEHNFLTSLEGNLPEYNIRIMLPEIQRYDLHEEEDERDDYDSKVITRMSLKRQSQHLVNSKTKIPTSRK